MSKNLKTILAIVGAVVAIAAAVAAIVIYRDQIIAAFNSCKEKCCAKKNKIIYADEFADYADV